MTDGIYTERDTERVITLVRNGLGQFVPQVVADGPDMEARFDYVDRSDSNPVYAGIGPADGDTAAEVWWVKQFTYDGSDRVTRIESQWGAWDNRAFLF